MELHRYDALPWIGPGDIEEYAALAAKARELESEWQDVRLTGDPTWSGGAHRRADRPRVLMITTRMLKIAPDLDDTETSGAPRLRPAAAN